MRGLAEFVLRYSHILYIHTKAYLYTLISHSANFALKFIKKNILNMTLNGILCINRYVDGYFSIVSEVKVDETLDKFNSLKSNIKLTY